MEKTFQYVNGADLLEQANKEAERLAKEEKAAQTKKCGNALLAFLNEKAEEGIAIREARIKAEESELEKNTEGIYAFFTAEKIAALIKNQFNDNDNKERATGRKAWILVQCYGTPYIINASIKISTWDHTENLEYKYSHSYGSAFVEPDTIREFILGILKQLGLKNPYYGPTHEYLYFSW